MSAPPIARLARPAMATMATLTGAYLADALNGALMASVMAAIERIDPIPNSARYPIAHGRALDRGKDGQHHRGASGQTVNQAHREGAGPEGGAYARPQRVAVTAVSVVGRKATVRDI